MVSKEDARNEAERLRAEFMARGGKITKITNADYGPIVWKKDKPEHPLTALIEAKILAVKKVDPITPEGKTTWLIKAEVEGFKEPVWIGNSGRNIQGVIKPGSIYSFFIRNNSVPGQIRYGLNSKPLFKGTFQLPQVEAALDLPLLESK